MGRFLFLRYAQYTYCMKKHAIILTITILTSLAQVFAMVPIPLESTYQKQSVSLIILSKFYNYSVVFLIFSQIFIVSYLLRLLYRIYILKLIAVNGVKKWLITLFAVLYSLTVLAIAFGWTYSIFGF